MVLESYLAYKSSNSAANFRQDFKEYTLEIKYLVGLPKYRMGEFQDFIRHRT